MKLVIEVDHPNDNAVYFPPTGTRLRGRFDARRQAQRNANAAHLLQQWTEPVPGQRLSIDTATGEGQILEPLRTDTDEHKAIRQLFEKRGIAVPEDQTFRNVHQPSWLFCMKDLIDAGFARIVEGKLPAKIDGERLKSFVTPDVEGPEDTLRRIVVENSTAMREAVDAIKQLAAAVAKGWGE